MKNTYFKLSFLFTTTCYYTLLNYLHTKRPTRTTLLLLLNTLHPQPHPHTSKHNYIFNSLQIYLNKVFKTTHTINEQIKTNAHIKDQKIGIPTTALIVIFQILVEHV